MQTTRAEPEADGLKSAVSSDEPESRLSFGQYEACGHLPDLGPVFPYCHRRKAIGDGCGGAGALQTIFRTGKEKRSWKRGWGGLFWCSNAEKQR